MTFMDDVHHESEVESYKAMNTLLLWVQTIAPLEESYRHVSNLLRICHDLKWPVWVDEQGLKLLKMPKGQPNKESDNG